jgi:low affinity Fe/Cu permease
MAVGDQHRHHDCHVLDGLRDPEFENRDGAAIQVKLDELIRVGAAHNSFVGIEHLTDDELDEIRTECERRVEAEKVGEETVKSTGKKAKRAADLVTE